MKKLVAVLLVILCVFVLVACNNIKDSRNTDPDAPYPWTRLGYTYD